MNESVHNGSYRLVGNQNSLLKWLSNWKYYQLLVKILLLACTISSTISSTICTISTTTNSKLALTIAPLFRTDVEIACFNSMWLYRTLKKFHYFKFPRRDWSREQKSKNSLDDFFFVVGCVLELLEHILLRWRELQET